MTRPFVLGFVVVAATWTACKTRPQSEGAPSTANTNANTNANANATTTANATATAHADAAHADAAPAAPVTAEAKKAYLAALGAGRKQTAAREFDLAGAAFTRALDAIPGDARALAERGYARFLAHDYDRAKDDLEFARAACDPKDKKLLAQIEFNLGLVCAALADAGKGTGMRGEATGHFRRSNDLSSSKAAIAKMAGCPIAWGAPTIDVTPSLADAKKKYGAAAEWTALDGEPGVLVHDQSDAGGTDVLLPLDAGRIARVEVGSTSMWRCGTLGEVSATKIGAIWKVVYQAHLGVASAGICMCGDATPCSTDYSANRDDPPCACDAPVCPMACGGSDAPSGAHIETFVDARSGAGVWRTEIDEAFAAQVQMDTDLAKMRFTASGLGCVADLPIGKP